MEAEEPGPLMVERGDLANVTFSPLGDIPEPFRAPLLALT